MPFLSLPSEELFSYGQNTARSLPVETRRAPKPLAKRLRRALAQLRRFGAGAADREVARWLADNDYLLEETVSAAGITLSHAGRLRFSGGTPLLPALCRAFLVAADGALTAGSLSLFLRGFQAETPLEQQELALLPEALRWSVLLLMAEEAEAGRLDGSTAGVLFTSLRESDAPVWGELITDMDTVEQIYARESAGVYPRMDECSRAMYRQETERLGRLWGLSGEKAAEKVLAMAESGRTDRERHVGHWLFTAPMVQRAEPPRGTLYAAFNILGTLFFSLAAGFALRRPLLSALFLLPVSQLIKALPDALLRRTSRPRRLPRLELAEGIPDEGRTLCVISVLLSSPADAPSLTRRLEEFFHAQRSETGNLLFGLLADLPECSVSERPEDREAVRALENGIGALNRKYGPRFFLFTRPRHYTEDRHIYAPWERKRGALLSLARYLSGRDSEIVCFGDADALRGTRYILTLDTDTRPYPGSVRQLIGTALHPLCRPAVDAHRRVVTRGYGILQPRIAVELPESQKTLFALLFSPQGGVDPYGSLCGEMYMDAFDSGGFSGKGLIHIESFLTCMDGRLPERRVLSHDALEGAFLRGGLAEDLEFTDGFPASCTGYYAREHRWIRGDWQNLPWILGRGRELPLIERWRLFDSLRRSLLPAGELFALTAALLLRGRAGLWLGAAGLAAVLLPALSPLWHTLNESREDLRLQLFSFAPHGLSAALVRAMAHLAILPYEAWIGVSAAVTALWRCGVSHRKLLQWRTGQEGERRSARSPGGVYRAMAVCPLVGCFLLLFSPGLVGRILGVLWALSPLSAWAMSLPAAPEKPLNEADRRFLLLRAGELWRFFAEQCTPEEHFLPPDNVQFSPPLGAAHRTSPTNMGFALLSVLSAADLGLAEEEAALSLAESLLKTMRKLPRQKGHFYNWYDTQTLEPLPPEYISTVDSGNLCACLLAAETAFRERGREQSAALCRELAVGMDFRPLYDPGRRLFRIGLTPGRKTDDSWYDLLESEARLTVYTALALGQTELRHWRQLGRGRTALLGYRGMVSWSGSLFEYRMPDLLLGLRRGSALWESARFALFVQRRHAGGRYGLWGISESAFAALSPDMSYRYKAHGCRELSLCRESGNEEVFSPYSAYLTLGLDTEAAMELLRRWEKAAPPGPYGLWEALDCTRERCPAGGVSVRCVMAHHAGMSMTAIANTLLQDIWVRRFYAHPEVSAYAALLEERVPLGGPLLRRRLSSPLRPTRPEAAFPTAEGEVDPWGVPVCTALSNGVYSLHLASDGTALACCGRAAVYRPCRYPWDAGCGVSLFLMQGGNLLPLLPEQGGKAAFRWSYTPEEARLTGELGPLRWQVSVSVSPEHNGEKRTLTILSDGPVTGDILLTVEPCLLPEREWRAQSAYARLGLFTERCGDALLCRRLPRNGQKELFLAVEADRSARFSSDLRAFPGRGGAGVFPEENTGWQCEALLALSVPLRGAAAGESVSFAIVTAPTRQAALNAAHAVVRGSGGFSMAHAASVTLGLTAGDYTESLAMLPRLLRPALSPAAAALPGQARDALWALGISGDLPILLAEGTDSQLLCALRCHAFLACCGVLCDLVLPLPGGSYREDRRQTVLDALGRMGREATAGAPGGVHLIPAEARDTALAHAAVCFGEPLPAGRAGGFLTPRPARCETMIPPWERRGREVSFTLARALPPRPWGHMLSDGSLSTFVSELGTHGLWYGNARECPLMPWMGDPLASVCAERLWVAEEDRAVSFFADGQGTLTVRYAPGLAVWEKTAEGLSLSLTAVILPERGIRLWLLRSDRPCRVMWCAPLQLAPEAADMSSCSVARDGDLLRAVNPRSAVPGLAIYARCSEPWESVFSDAAAPGEPFAPRAAVPALGGSFLLRGEAVLSVGTAAPPPLAPAEAAALIRSTEEYWDTKLSHPFPPPEDEVLRSFGDGWLLYQTVAGRLWGRCSPYQCGGAIGFRDQIQDYVNLLPLEKEACREHLLRCCAHQFSEGDVQHWYHPGSGDTDKGVRTRCSDDLLWLPWGLCRYVEETGDRSVLAERRPYLTAPALRPEEASRYELPALSGESGTAADHALRAMELVWERGCGVHGLLLMGSGDWNDGMDSMPPGSESVWLTWFASIVFRRWSLLTGDSLWEERAAALGRAAEATWTGDRYLRGYYADGTPLGAPGGAQCAIDSISQSFAAFCPYADAEHVRAALSAAAEQLFDREHHLLRLFWPPFSPDGMSPGYIASYGPGFRENGGQYTHGALWLVLALLRTGRRDEGTVLLKELLSALSSPAYGAEPYVVPADIYAAPGMEGRAGWTWYTGSAGWLFRILYRELNDEKNSTDAEKNS